MHLKYIPIYIQQDATLHSLFVSGNCSTCFGWYLHPSSGAHTTVSTASGQIPAAVDTVVCASDDGWRYHPKHVEQFPDTNKRCKVASCWIYIRIYYIYRYKNLPRIYVICEPCMGKNVLQFSGYYPCGTGVRLEISEACFVLITSFDDRGKGKREGIPAHAVKVYKRVEI